MTQSLTVYQAENFNSMMQIGTLLAQSGFFADSKGAAQAVTKMMAGAEIGFGPIASMTGIHVISGRVSISANLMAAAIKRSGRYDYRVREMTPQRCEIEFRERYGDKWEIIGSSEFTAQDARLAGTKNMDKYARNMLFARAMSNGARWYCPDIFGGPVYTPEELGAAVDGETGEVIDAPAPRIVVERQPEQQNGAQQASTQQAQVGDQHAMGFKSAARPWSVDNTIAALRYTAASTKNELPVNGQWGALIGLLDSAPFDTASRHALLKAVFGVDSSKDMTGQQRYALHVWAKPAKVDGAWCMDANAFAEYQSVVGLDIPDTNDPDGWQETTRPA